jgi:hypothetical protein
MTQESSGLTFNEIKLGYKIFLIFVVHSSQIIEIHINK